MTTLYAVPPVTGTLPLTREQLQMKVDAQAKQIEHLETIAGVNGGTIAEQQRSISNLYSEIAKARIALRDMTNERDRLLIRVDLSVAALRGAILNAEWIVNPHYDHVPSGLQDKALPTLEHLFAEIGYDLADSSEAMRVFAGERAAEILSGIATGALPLKLACWKCGDVKSRCECCRAHRLATENYTDRCADCSVEVARRNA